MISSFVDELHKIAAAPKSIPDAVAARLLARYDDERREKYLQGLGEQANPWNIPETAAQAGLTAAGIPITMGLYGSVKELQPALEKLRRSEAYKAFGAKHNLAGVDVEKLLSAGDRAANLTKTQIKNLAIIENLVGRGDVAERVNRGMAMGTVTPTAPSMVKLRHAIERSMHGFQTNPKVQRAFMKSYAVQALRGAARKAAPAAGIAAALGALAAYKRYRTAREKIHGPA